MPRLFGPLPFPRSWGYCVEAYPITVSQPCRRLTGYDKAKNIKSNKFPPHQIFLQSVDQRNCRAGGMHITVRAHHFPDRRGM